MPTLPVPESQPDVATMTRPWGHFEQYAYDEPVTVSLMLVREGRTLSLQSPTRRAELRVVLEVACGDRSLGDIDRYEDVHRRPVQAS